MGELYRATVETELNRDGIYNHVSIAVPELRWRRAESEADGAHIISGSNDLGCRVTFYLYEDEIGRASVSMSLRSATPDANGSVAWQEDLRAKLFDVVFPALESTEPGPGETGRPPGYRPPKPQGRPEAGSTSAPTASPATPSAPAPPTPVIPPVPGLNRPSTARPERDSRVGQRLWSGAEVVVDLYQWLPGWGEESITHRSDGGEVAVVVTYDLDRDPDVGTAEISLLFESAEHFSAYWWPSEGGSFEPGSLDGADTCTVYDVGRSALLDRSRKDRHRQLGRSRALHHYVVYFLESGMAFEAVAAGVRVE